MEQELTRAATSRWDERFLLDTIRPLEKVAPEIDFVLLSHPDLAHLGALPYAFALLGLD